MKFNRETFLEYVEQVEKEYAASSTHEDTLANGPLNKPIPSFDGGICVWWTDYVVFFDCVLSGCKQGDTTWTTYISLYNRDDNHLHRTWEVTCHTMETFKTLVDSICKCEHFAQVVALIERSEWCEG